MSYLCRNNLKEKECNLGVWFGLFMYMVWARAAVVHLNFRVGSTFPVLVCTVPPGHRVNKADTQ